MISAFQVKQIRTVLIVLIAASILAGGAYFLLTAKRYSLAALTGRDVAPAGTNGTAASSVTLKSEQEYRGLFMAKKLFRPLVKKVYKQEKTETIDDVTRDLMLIGVVKQTALEAMIKNRRTRQTYMVRAGMMVGKVKIENVEDDKVVVSFDGAKKTLFIQ